MEIMVLLNTAFTWIEILFIQRHRHFDMEFVVIHKKREKKMREARKKERT